MSFYNFHARIELSKKIVEGKLTLMIRYSTKSWINYQMFKSKTFRVNNPKDILDTVHSIPTDEWRKKEHRVFLVFLPSLIYQSLDLPYSQVNYNMSLVFDANKSVKDFMTINGVKVSHRLSEFKSYMKSLYKVQFSEHEFKEIATSFLEEKIPAAIKSIPKVYLNNIMLLRILRAGGDIDDSMFSFR